MLENTKRLKYACYTSNISMSVVANLSPILFVVFRSLYGISYSLLGLLVLINFFTQLLIDLIFSFGSHKINISKVVKAMPAITVTGLAVYAVYPLLFPESAYVGLVLGTVIFALSAGLAEVLISPIIAALPSPDPEREMSKLHSTYAWGVVGVVIFSTLFLLAFGKESWHWLALLWMIIPLGSWLLFSKAKLPNLQNEDHGSSGSMKLIFNKGFILCILCIFLGGASEAIMAQWSSSYLEQAMNIPKVWGDVAGVALFAVMLGLGRTLYAKRGKNIIFVLFVGSSFAFLCYLTATFANVPLIGLFACAFTGLCVSMLWPGSLIAASNKFPSAGVALFALMAAGGDLGSSVGPQLVGIVTDAVINNPGLSVFASNTGLTPEQIGMKTGMLVASIFPFLAAILFATLLKQNKSKKKKEETKA